MYFPHMLARDVHYHSKREHREEILDQRKTKTRWTNSKLSPCQMSRCLSDLQLLSALLSGAHFLLVLNPLPVSSFPWQVISWLWHLQGLGVSKAMEALTSQLRTMA